jgi:hypothetical protein
MSFRKNTDKAELIVASLILGGRDDPTVSRVGANRPLPRAYETIIRLSSTVLT